MQKNYPEKLSALI